jgi:hypothetical protein
VDVLFLRICIEERPEERRQETQPDFLGRVNRKGKSSFRREFDKSHSRIILEMEGAKGESLSLKNGDPGHFSYRWDL